MRSKRLRALMPVVLTLAAIIGLALGPGSRQSLEQTQLSAAILPTETPTTESVQVEEIYVVATDTPIPPTLQPTPTLTPSVTPTRVPTHTRTPTIPLSTTVTPTFTATPSSRTIRAPILMYHYVSVPPADADKIRVDLSVTPDAFRAQMDYLAANGYHPVRLAELADYLEFGAPLPDKPIVLTFDDGYSDNYANAFPILREHKFVGTFFVIVNAIEENRWGYMSWPQLDEMQKSGMEIGSHTLDHPDLQGKSRAYQTKEIVDSKQMITQRLGVPVVSFSYPAGKYDANTLPVINMAGYTSAVVDSQGARHSTENILELKRIRVRGTYSVTDFANWIKYFTDNGK